MQKPKSREAMVQEILITLKANSVYVDGDLYFSLVFRTDEQLRGMCRELHISTTEWAS